MADEPKMHWFKFFPAEFLSSPEVQALTLEQQGGLLRLWCCYFRLRDNLPADLEAVARMAQVPVDACALLMHQFFEQEDDGTWFSPRLQKELEESLGRSEKGKKAADTRWRKKRKSRPSKGQGAACMSNARAMLDPPASGMREQCHLDIDADSDPDAESTHPAPEGSPQSGAIHSESVDAAESPSLLGPDRQTRSYASTSEPVQAGELLRGSFRGRAV